MYLNKSQPKTIFVEAKNIWDFIQDNKAALTNGDIICVAKNSLSDIIVWIGKSEGSAYATLSVFIGRDEHEWSLLTDENECPLIVERIYNKYIFSQPFQRRVKVQRRRKRT
jgi:hypothetical protein